MPSARWRHATTMPTATGPRRRRSHTGVAIPVAGFPDMMIPARRGSGAADGLRLTTLMRTHDRQMTALPFTTIIAALQHITASRACRDDLG